MHKHCFQFLLGHTIREVENSAYAKFWRDIKEYYGILKKAYSSLTFGQVVLTFCLPRATSCLSLLMTLLEDDFPAPLFIGQLCLSQQENLLVSGCTGQGSFQVLIPFQYLLWPCMAEISEWSSPTLLILCGYIGLKFLSVPIKTKRKNLVNIQK